MKVAVIVKDKCKIADLECKILFPLITAVSKSTV